MACCGKGRSTKEKKLLDSKTLKQTLRLLETITDASLATISDKELLEYHIKSHSLNAANKKITPLNKTLINSMYLLHKQIIKEMLKRNIKHNTPLKKI